MAASSSQSPLPPPVATTSTHLDASPRLPCIETITDVCSPLALRLGDRFTCFTEFEERLQRHSAADFVNYWRRDSRTVNGALLKTARPIADCLRYYSVLFACVHGGQKFGRRGHGHRNKPTMRCDCPAHISLRATKCGQQLEVVAVCNRHNHPVTESGARALPQNRRLPVSVRSVVLQMMQQQVDPKQIHDYVSETTGMRMTRKELDNLRRTNGVIVQRNALQQNAAVVDLVQMDKSPGINNADFNSVDSDSVTSEPMAITAAPIASHSDSKLSLSPIPQQPHDGDDGASTVAGSLLDNNEIYFEVIDKLEVTIDGGGVDDDDDDLVEEYLLDSVEDEQDESSDAGCQRLESIKVERLATPSPAEYLHQLTPEADEDAEAADLDDTSLSVYIDYSDETADAEVVVLDGEHLSPPPTTSSALASTVNTVTTMTTSTTTVTSPASQLHSIGRWLDPSSERLCAEIAALQAENRRLTAETQILRQERRSFGRAVAMKRRRTQ